MNSTTTADSPPSISSRSTAHASLITVFALGAGIQLWLWWRSVWIYWDQAALYGQALEWLESGDLGGLGKSMTGGYRGPAGLLQLLVGAPLLVWESGRASSLVVVLFHFAGGALLVRALSQLVDRWFAVAFLAICWLAPFRLYLGSFVWEPSYLFLPAAIHLWACARLRTAPESGFTSARVVSTSLLLGLAVAAAPQLHPSGVVLFFLTLLLFLNRALVPSWTALLAGLGLGALPALPAILDLAGGTPVHGNGGELTLSQFAWLPISACIKAVVYWFRLPSADIGRRLAETDLCSGSEPGLVGGAVCAYLWLLVVAATLSVGFCVVANVLYCRDRGADGEGAAGQQWLRQYVGLALLALFSVAFIAPFRIQSWYTIAILPAASVPVAWWLWHALGRGGRRRSLLWLVAAFLSVRLLVVGTLGVGHPMFVTPERPELLWQPLPSELRFLVPGGGVQ